VTGFHAPILEQDLHQFMDSSGAAIRKKLPALLHTTPHLSSTERAIPGEEFMLNLGTTELNELISTL
jgi:hypothetical protein